MPAAVKVSGAFFRGDVGGQAKRAVRKVVSAVGAVAKSEVQADLTKGHGRDSGAFRSGIRRKTKGLETTVYARNSAIAQWLEGTGKLNSRSRFKGYQIFARAAARTDAKAGNEAREGVAELVRILGGS
jgi:hypothetical protein